ncbi:MAG: hypothetical protein ACLQGJ_04115 [Candidatus Dormibacteria bacterium]
MKRTAKDPVDPREEASREAARRELEEARRIAEGIPQTSIWTGRGPDQVDQSQK